MTAWLGITHDITVEERKATCCDRHLAYWVVCSCGFEDWCGSNDRGESFRAITGHRLDVIEKQVGIKVKIGA